MPVPRRFDRRPPERDQTRINERIRVPEVRVIGEDGQQIGVMRTDEALRYAQERDLDLVEVAPDARPPVTRILDYSKYKYEQAQKQKAARKHQQQITIREIKFRPKIALNDYETKKGHVTRFLKRKDKVKITIMFRGREVTHPERGQQLLERLAEELKDLATVEQRPNLDGRNMTMMLGPSKAVLAGQYDAGADPQATDEVAAVADDAPAEAATEGAATTAANGAAVADGASDSDAPAADGAGDAGAPQATAADAADAPAADAADAPAADAADAPAADAADAPEDDAVDEADNTPADDADATPADEPAAAEAPAASRRRGG
ncbi:MAG: translation initiation factor [Solirubrobacteraceae bacterium]|nr:translation initiation factor [Solirubrobacteraceae bacterium]